MKKLNSNLMYSTRCTQHAYPFLRQTKYSIRIAPTPEKNCIN
ncbi:hypothetical protein ABXT08_04230 [Chryseobacterium sp. NRRL B-14859]|nr:hypothetical protein [Chryseobacterium sp. G0240]